MKFIKVLYLATVLSLIPAGTLVAQSTTNHFMHTVTKGQSLYSISSMYNVPIAEIVKLNPGSDERIKVGQALKIPQTGNSGKVIFHTIQPGETLYKLTVRYGVTSQRICQANPGLSAKNFRVGQVIAIPPVVAEKVSEPVIETPTQPQKQEALKPKCRDMHKVKRKETIYSICKEYGITEQELIEANPELKTEKLKKGKFLCIPYPKETAPQKPVVQTPETTQAPTDAELFDKNRTENRKLGTIK